MFICFILAKASGIVIFFQISGRVLFRRHKYRKVPPEFTDFKDALNTFTPSCYIYHGRR